jgi:hypothetical protein
MSKDQLFTGQPIFSQLLNFIERSNIARISQEFESDRYCKKITTYNHLVTMLYCIYHNCTSIREVTTGMQACFFKNQTSRHELLSSQEHIVRFQ